MVTGSDSQRGLHWETHWVMPKQTVTVTDWHSVILTDWQMDWHWHLETGSVKHWD